MIDPRENKPFDPRQEVKDKLKDCGYPFEITEANGMTVVKFDLPTGALSISIKQAARKPMADIKALIDAAMNQEKIIEANRVMMEAAVKDKDSREADME
jgi:hypothetical protein